MEIKVRLNPNPRFEGDPLATEPLGNRTHKMINNPFLEVILYNIENGNYKINLLSPIKLEKEVVINSKLKSIFFIDQVFENPSITEVSLVITGENLKKEFLIPIKMHKLWGKVTDCSGIPLSAYIWLVNETVDSYELGEKINKTVVKSNQRGEYELYYQEGFQLSVFICDIKYHKSHLETWVEAEELKQDIEINPQIGNLEVYRPQVWFRDNHWNIYFLPAWLIKEPFAPEIDIDEIEVYVNNIRTEITNLYKIDLNINKSNKKYPAYLLEVKSLKENLFSPVIIKIKLNSSSKGKGESYYIYPSNVI